MNIPNILTVFRVLLVFVFAKLFLMSTQNAMIGACIVFAVASITDFFDGYIARKYNLITSFGKIMDPIADKFLVLTAFYLFSRIGYIAFWMFVVIAVREVVVTIIRLVALKQKKVIAAENLGKIKTVMQIVVISVMLIFAVLKYYQDVLHWSDSVFSIIGGIVTVMMYIVVGLTVVSGCQFFMNLNKQGGKNE